MSGMVSAILRFLVPPSVPADVYKFTWDKSKCAYSDGVRLYIKHNDNYKWLWTGCGETATVEILLGTRGHVVCRPFVGGVEGKEFVPTSEKVVKNGRPN